MVNDFHDPISSEEFKYALNVWSGAISGKIPVPEFNELPAGKIVWIELIGPNDKTITIARYKTAPSAKAIVAVIKAFATSRDECTSTRDKCTSIIMHLIVFEQIVTNPLFNKFVADRSLFSDPFLDLIRNIPIKVGEEGALNKLNMNYILERFEALANEHI